MNYHYQSDLYRSMIKSFNPSNDKDHITLELRAKITIGVNEQTHHQEFGQFFNEVATAISLTGARVENITSVIEKTDHYCGSLREKLNYDAQFENVKEIY